MSETTDIQQSPTPRPLRLAIVTVSDTRSLQTDKSGDVIFNFAQRAGHHLVERIIVKDEIEAIRGAVRTFCESEEIEVVLATGGTGITGRDVTPEAISPLVTKEIPGFGELFRMLSYSDIGTATIQSRAFAAVCGTTLVFALPGSTNAVRFAIDKILWEQFDVRKKPCNFAQLLPRLREGAPA